MIEIPAALRALLDWATAAGAEDRLLRAAAAELLQLLEVEPDRRRLETLQRGREIERLAAQGMTRAQICERIGISKHSHQRAVTALRDSRSAVGLQELRRPEKERV